GATDRTHPASGGRAARPPPEQTDCRLPRTANCVEETPREDQGPAPEQAIVGLGRGLISAQSVPYCAAGFPVAMERKADILGLNRGFPRLTLSGHARLLIAAAQTDYTPLRH